MPRLAPPHARRYSSASVPRDGDMSLVAAARDVLAVVDGALTNRTGGGGGGGGAPHRRCGDVHLVGHDWGSAVAQVAARLRPARFRSLTLLAVGGLRDPLPALATFPAQLAYSW